MSCITAPLVTSLLAGLATPAWQDPAPPAGPVWETDLELASALARETDRPLLIVFR